MAVCYDAGLKVSITLAVFRQIFVFYFSKKSLPISVLLNTTNLFRRDLCQKEMTLKRY